ncbi:MAG: nitrate/nitrite transporter NrtS [Burkholderiales bacterium]
MSQHIKTVLAYGFSQPILSNSIKIALVVGTILNVINQGESIVQEGDVRWGSFLLNYMIPFCVSCYSAARHAMHRR